MIKRLAESLADKIISGGTALKNSDRSRIVYSLECIGYEISKVTVFFVVFLCAGYLKEYVVALLAMYLLRPFIGGYHAKRNSVCWVVSFFYFAFIILFSRLLYPDSLMKWLAILFCLVSISVFAPVVREVAKRSRRSMYRLKWISVAITGALSVYVLMNQNLYSNIIFYSIIETVLFAYIGFFSYRTQGGTNANQSG